MELLRMSSQSGKTLEADQVFVSHPYIVILFPNIFFICDFQSLDISVPGPGFPRGDRPMYLNLRVGHLKKNNKLHLVPRRNVIQNVLKSGNIVFAECIVPVRSVSGGTTQQNVPTDWSAGGLHQGTPVSEVRCMYRWRPGPARKWSVSATTLVPVTNPPDRIVNWWVKLPKTMRKPSGNVQQWPLNRSRKFNRLIKTSYFLFS